MVDPLEMFFFNVFHISCEYNINTRKNAVTISKLFDEYLRLLFLQGVITTISDIDREEKGLRFDKTSRGIFELLVSATDGGTPALSSATNAKVKAFKLLILFTHKWPIQKKKEDSLLISTLNKKLLPINKTKLKSFRFFKLEYWPQFENTHSLWLFKISLGSPFTH